MNFLARTTAILMIVTGINPIFIIAGLVILSGTILNSVLTSIKI